ncbi:MAG: hypothetical protein PHF86_07840 [Candidatus Nanoarchaeia archaeon]|jgi:hypothetical protein|nr:hypothetical protein [Candidatus Nanoarchaeia archaeon]
MAEKANPWLDEGNRYDDEDRPRQKIRDMKFFDNTTHTVRILPSKKAGDFPFHGYKQHWIPQNGTQVGKPITHGIDERCSVCDWVSTQWDEIHRLKEEEDMTDKSPEVEALLKKVGGVSAKTRYDMNVLHREDLLVSNEETGVKEPAPKRMSVGSTVYKEIFGFAKKWGSPSNDESGYDLEIITSGSKERREYRTVPDRNTSPLTADEKKLIEKGFDLKELRKNTSASDIKKILENAKAPYNEISQYLGEETASRRPRKEKAATVAPDPVEEVEKEIRESTKQAESVKTEPKPEPVKTPAPEPVAESQPVDDEHNIEVYECKGDFDENDKMCSDCPVKNACEEIHPFYVKAKQLKIDIDPHRPTKEIVAEVKKAEAPAQEPSKRGKRIPF